MSISIETSLVERRATQVSPLQVRLLCAVALSAYFVVVYGVANAVTAHRAANGVWIPSFYFQWERRIPLIPALIVPYMSIDLFFFGAPFLCDTAGELRTHVRRIL